MSPEFELYHELSCLGATAEMNFEIPLLTYQQEVATLQDQWVTYNPRKPGYNRYGLSLTSLDGGVTGVPDLDSLREYNRLNGTQWVEKDFKIFTSHASHLKSLKPILNAFEGDFGRTHVIRLDRGGFFPPHRDVFGSKADSFRVIVILNKYGSMDYKFILDEKVQNFIPGRAYFVNTMLSHSLFSFVDDFQILVCNIITSSRSIERVHRALTVR